MSRCLTQRDDGGGGGDGTIGADCTTADGTVGVYDCQLQCVDAVTAQAWIGDGFCDDGSYQYNGNDIYFNCEEFNNDNGDCDALHVPRAVRGRSGAASVPHGRWLPAALAGEPGADPDGGGENGNGQKITFNG